MSAGDGEDGAVGGPDEGPVGPADEVRAGGGGGTEPDGPGRDVRRPFSGAGPTGGAGEEGAARAVRVTIFGEDYRIRTRLGEEYTRRCARYVDDAIQEAHIGGHVVEPHRAAILAAMKLTDELFRLRGELDRTRRETTERNRAVEGRLEELARRIREALPEA